MSSPSDAARPPTTSSGSASNRPSWWPHFSSTLRSTAVTARVGRALGIAIAICFGTGLFSYYQYDPWLGPVPAMPVWGYRVTQGLHVATGIVALPLLFFKLWTVYPNLFRWPPVKGWRKAVERLSVAILVAAALLQFCTGFINLLAWYAFRWDFLTVHYYLAWVVVGSVLLHIGIKLPDIVYGLQTKPVADGDVLTEIPWNENPDSHSNAGKLAAPETPGISRRGMLAAAGAGLGIVAVTTVGQTLTPLEPLGLLAVRQPSRGPQGVPINRTSEEAGVRDTATAADWVLEVRGPRPYRLTLADLEGLATRTARYPITCVEGWSSDADWRGLSLLEIVQRAGGSADSRVGVFSMEQNWIFSRSKIFGPQLSAALLATHINGERLSVDHGYPLRLIAPNRAGVMNTKWLARIEVS